MYVLHAEKRDPGLKAKQLKKTGCIPGSIYGSDIDGSVLIQLHQNDVKQLLKSKAVGNKITLSLKEKNYSVMIKELGRNPLGNQIEHMCFQSLADDEMVTSAARIILLNKEKVTNFIQQRLYEIPYKALPAHLVEATELDLEGMSVDTCVKVEDLDIARNENIELLVEPGSLVLTIVGSRKSVIQLPE
jgi:large subunit ribosomal protein L25